MTRSLPEWIGKTDDTPIPQRVKARVFLAQDGICGCGCGVKMAQSGEGVDYDHITALINGGENREGNIQALRRPCHKAKTRRDVAKKSVTARKRANHLGIREAKHPLPGSRKSKWKRKISGEVLRREDQ